MSAANATKARLARTNPTVQTHAVVGLGERRDEPQVAGRGEPRPVAFSGRRQSATSPAATNVSPAVTANAG